MSNEKRNDAASADKLLDLLLDALEERLAARQDAATAKPTRTTRPESKPQPKPQAQPTPARTPTAVKAKPKKAERTPQPGDPDWELPPKAPSIHLDAMIKRLLVLVLGLTILFNIPVTRYGVSLARIMPDSAALIIRDGLVIKGEGPEIYVLQDNKLRWISSLDAFERYGYRWTEVHEVDDEFLADFEIGEPIHVLFKCPNSPHIYRIEEGKKRWIKDIETFTAEGHVWDDVQLVDCLYLRNMPTGLPIPEDAGPVPEP